MNIDVFKVKKIFFLNFENYYNELIGISIEI